MPLVWCYQHKKINLAFIKPASWVSFCLAQTWSLWSCSAIPHPHRPPCLVNLVINITQPLKPKWSQVEIWLQFWLMKPRPKTNRNHFSLKRLGGLKTVGMSFNRCPLERDPTPFYKLQCFSAVFVASPSTERVFSEPQSSALSLFILQTGHPIIYGIKGRLIRLPSLVRPGCQTSYPGQDGEDKGLGEQRISLKWRELRALVPWKCRLAAWGGKTDGESQEAQEADGRQL